MTFKSTLLLFAFVVYGQGSSAHDLFPNGQVKFRSLLSEPQASAEWIARGGQCGYRWGERALGQYDKYSKMNSLRTHQHVQRNYQHTQVRRQAGQGLQVRLTDRSGLAKE